jgi:hypothetical protein
MCCGTCPLEYPDTGLQVIKSVNWCWEQIALDRTPQEKNPVVLCLVNVEAKTLDRLCRSMFLEMSCLGTRLPVNPNEVEHHLVPEWCVAVSVQCVVLRTVASCPGRCSR